MTFSSEQRRMFEQRLQELLSEIIKLTDCNKDIMKVFEQLYKLKFAFERDQQINKITPKKIDKKALKAEISDMMFCEAIQPQ